jgi:hypothetical protein
MVFYHPASSGNGSAVRFELKAAEFRKEGCIFAQLAAQRTAATREGGRRQAATFGWQEGLTVKLGLSDVCAILLVLEGKTTSAGGDKDLFHQTDSATTIISFKRIEEPIKGYAFEVSRKTRQQGDAQPTRIRIVLNEGEACGLRHLLSSSIFHLCFYVGQPYGDKVEEDAVEY